MRTRERACMEFTYSPDPIDLRDVPRQFREYVRRHGRPCAELQRPLKYGGDSLVEERVYGGIRQDLRRHGL